MFSEMTSRERILAAIRHEPLDRVPMDYWGIPEATKKICRGIGARNEEEFIRILRLDKIRNVTPRYIGPALREANGERTDVWGVVTKRVAYRKAVSALTSDGRNGQDALVDSDGNLGIYDEIIRHPLTGLETIDQVEAAYTWPSADWYDFSDIAAQCDRFKGYAIEGGYMAPFYVYNNIRGLEDSLVDLATEPELAEYVLDRICSFYREYHTRLFDAANGKLHLAQVTDDFGTQNGLMISPEMYRRHFRPRVRSFVQLVKSYGLHVFHHDDGAIMQLLPDLCEDGIEVLNPLQWHLPGMDLAELKSRYGDRLCFHGGIDNQYVLAFGSTEEVEAEVRTCIEQLAEDGTGYILAPCHNVQAVSPVENVVAMYDAGWRHGIR